MQPPLTQPQLRARNTMQKRNKFGVKTPEYHQNEAKVCHEKADLLRVVAGSGGKGAWWSTIVRLEAKAEMHIAHIPHAAAHVSEPRQRITWKVRKPRGAWR